VSTIFKFSDNKISVFLKSDRFGSPNGLLTDGKDILLGTGDRVVRINIQTGKVTDYMLNTGGVDGIALTASDVLLFSNWQGTVYKMKLGSDKELLLDTSKTEAIKSADFGYDASNKMIFLPTFFGNSVVCYKLAK
jgi:hypothetical protein